MNQHFSRSRASTQRTGSSPALPRTHHLRRLRPTLAVWIAVLSSTVPLAAQSGVPQQEPEGAEHSVQRDARALQQSTFGATPALLDEVQAAGFEAWLGQQLASALPITLHEPMVAQLLADTEAALAAHPGLRNEPQEVRQQLFQTVRRYLQPSHRYSWWQAAMSAPDQVRQRVAFALSELFVVSDTAAELERRPQSLASYYDVLVRGALGNYRDVLREVTLHPAMGVFLSHLNNARSNSDLGIFPDENYAREVLQLFSIGLDELNRDGSPKLDADGHRIPTYTNAEITEFAKIFTGLGPGEITGRFGGRTNGTVPMRMYEDFHEPGEKRLLGGTVVPSGQTGMQDIEAAIDNLFLHPNVAPFISRRLIQRLVTSNPTPAYLDRVAQVFENNGGGIRGDLAATVRAILLDSEARVGDLDEDLWTHHGKLQEPWLRYVALLRAFEASSPNGTFINTGFRAQEALSQHPLSAPSVFNFFSPDFRPNGPVAAAGLSAPEFQITNSLTVLSVSNFLDAVIFEVQPNQVPLFGILCLANLDLCIEAARCSDRGCTQEVLLSIQDQAREVFEQHAVSLDLDSTIALSADLQLDALIERLGLLLAGGALSEETRSLVYDTISAVEAPELRARTAIYLIAISPEAAVAR